MGINLETLSNKLGLSNEDLIRNAKQLREVDPTMGIYTAREIACCSYIMDELAKMRKSIMVLQDQSVLQKVKDYCILSIDNTIFTSEPNQDHKDGMEHAFRMVIDMIDNLEK